jgi:hypothetical protein
MKQSRILSAVLLLALSLACAGERQIRGTNVNSNDPVQDAVEEVDPAVVIEHFETNPDDKRDKMHEQERNLRHSDRQMQDVQQDEAQREDTERYTDTDLGEEEDEEEEDENKAVIQERRNLRRSHTYWNGSYRSPRRYRRRSGRSGYRSGYHGSGSGHGGRDFFSSKSSKSSKSSGRNFFDFFNSKGSKGKGGSGYRSGGSGYHGSGSGYHGSGSAYYGSGRSGRDFFSSKSSKSSKSSGRNFFDFFNSKGSKGKGGSGYRSGGSYHRSYGGSYGILPFGTPRWILSFDWQRLRLLWQWR